MKSFGFVIGLVLLLGSVSAAFAAPAFYEGFDYAAGSNVMNQGGWVPYAAGYNSYVVEATGASYTDASGNQLAVSGKSAYQATSPKQYNLMKQNVTSAVNDLFTTQGTFYITMLWKEQGNLVFSGSTTIDFGTYIMSTDWYQPRLYVGAAPAAKPYGNHYWNGTQYDFYAMKIVNNGAGQLDEITILRNPDLLNPNWDDTESNYRMYQNQADITGTYSIFYLLGGGGMGGPEDVGGVDELRIARDWVDAAPMQVVPEPATLSALAMGCAMLFVRRRRA